MRDIKILLAGQDEGYLLEVQKKILDELRDGAELQLVSDPGYLQAIFSTPQSFDIVLMEECIDVPDLDKHNIGALFILVEDPAAERAEQGRAWVYKYTGIKELYAKTVASQLKNHALPGVRQQTGVVLMYSPMGGTGQTTMAAGLCAALSGLQKRVLYVGMDSLQTFGVMLPGVAPLQPGAEKPLASGSEYAYDALRPYLVDIGFAALPPLPAALSSLGLGYEQYMQLIEGAKRSGEYDFIVVDAPRDFTQDTTRLMAASDKIFLLTMQDAVSAHKFGCLLHNIDCTDPERFIIVCNKYDTQQQNALAPLTEQGYSVRCYIPWDGQLQPAAGAYAAGLDAVRGMALLCI